MPIYEFQCQACGTKIEVLQKISDPHLTDCEACGKAEMKKNVTAAAFRLSGAGWYETDFKEGDKKKNLTETSSDSSSADSSKNASEGSSDTKAKKSEDTKASSKDSSDKPANKDSGKATTKTETSTKETSKPKKTTED